jgi:hypothetical protein
MKEQKFTEITYDNSKAETERYLREEYARAEETFSPASPFGQLLDVLTKYHQLGMLYLKNTIRGLDLSLPNSNNERNIFNQAIISGHTPGRPISSSGTLKLVVKNGIDLDSEVPGRSITLTDKSTLKNKTNGLNYSIRLPQETLTVPVNSNSQLFLNVVQGEFATSFFTGDGRLNQSFQLTLRSGKSIENNNITVTVNGEKWTIRKNILELGKDEKGCVVKTGFNGGVDVFFGNGRYGAIPPIGTPITVDYLISDGSIGNIFRRTQNDWTFIDDVFDGQGGTINISDVFDVLIFNDINFGSDGETPEFTKSLLPISSNNYVLGLARQYAYTIKRLGVFSHVDAYDDDGVIRVVATPDIKLFKNKNANYFDVDTSAFELDNYEKSKIDKYLRSGQYIQLTRKYRIDSPVLSYYTINIMYIRYSDTTDENIQNEMLSTLSDYLLDLKNVDRIPRSDISRILSQLPGIHSVDVQFISKKNEDYHREELNRKKIKSTLSEGRLSVNEILENPDYDKNSTPGLDPLLGDVLFDAMEFPIIRGGWYDRNGIFYSDDNDSTGLKSVNFFRTNVVDFKKRPI